MLSFFIRKKSTQKAGTNGNVNNSYQQEESDDTLPYNVLYVPAGKLILLVVATVPLMWVQQDPPKID